MASKSKPPISSVGQLNGWLLDPTPAKTSKTVNQSPVWSSPEKFSSTLLTYVIFVVGVVMDQL